MNKIGFFIFFARKGRFILRRDIMNESQSMSHKLIGSAASIRAFSENDEERQQTARHQSVGLSACLVLRHIGAE